MDWNKFARDVHEVAVKNGLWDKPRSFDDIVCECLVHLGRAYEEHRNGRPNYYHLCVASGDKRNPCDWDLGKPCPVSTGELACEHRDHKPHGAAAELGECVLRVLDYLAISEEGPMLPIEPLVPGGDFAKVICDLHGQLADARRCNQKGWRCAAEGYMHLCIEIIFGWAAQNNIDMESILRELHECEKARAGRREGATP